MIASAIIFCALAAICVAHRLCSMHERNTRARVDLDIAAMRLSVAREREAAAIRRMERRQRIAKAVELIVGVYAYSDVGGNLHVQLDDGNLQNIHFKDPLPERFMANTTDRQWAAEVQCYQHMRTMTRGERVVAAQKAAALRRRQHEGDLDRAAMALSVRGV